MKILILASNPRKDLNLDREIRDLREVIEKSRNRQEYQVEDALAVRVRDLQDLLFKHRPEIVHFCGHGSGQRGLVFEGNDGGEQWVRTEDLLQNWFSSCLSCSEDACITRSPDLQLLQEVEDLLGRLLRSIDNNAIAALLLGAIESLVCGDR